MKKAIILLILIGLSVQFAYSQKEKTSNLLFTSINNRNHLKTFKADIEYIYRGFADIELNNINYSIVKIEDDSFLIKFEGNVFKNFLFDFLDTLYVCSVNKVKSEFSFQHFPQASQNTTIGSKSLKIKKILGQHVDSGYIDMLAFNSMKDTALYGIPCWVININSSEFSIAKTLQHLLFISKSDTLIRGFYERETYNEKDTVIYFSFIKKITLNKDEINKSVKLHTNEVNVIKNTYKQIPVKQFKLNQSLYTGYVNSVSAYNLDKGDSVKLNFSKGKFFLDFWFIGCFPCMQSFPAISNLESLYKDKSVNFIKINPIDTKDIEKTKRFCTLHGIEGQNLLISRDLCAMFKVTSYPSFVFIEDGKIIKSFAGFDESIYDELKSYLKQWTQETK